MIKKLSKDAWNNYRSLLPPTRRIYEPVLPQTLPYQGKVEGAFDYVLPEEILARIRTWQRQNGEKSAYYFLTESVDGEETDFEVAVDQLTGDNLKTVNTNNENVIVATDFSWAVFVDHEGALHVAGPLDLFLLLSAEISQSET